MKLAGIVTGVVCLLLASLEARAQEKPFVIVMNHQPDNIDVTKALNGVISYPLLENINEKLVYLDKNGIPTPGLATWEVAPDGLAITFHVRPGVKFSSGDPFTADDIVFSHERFKTNATYKSADPFLDHVEKIDDMTVKLVFRQPEATYFSRRALMIVSKSYFDRVGEAEFSAHPVGTGAYKLVSYSPGQNAVLEAFDGYWGGAPEIKHVRMDFIGDDATRVAKLQAGEADMILNVPYPQVDKLKAAGF